MAELKARHAFGSSSGIDAALEANTIDALDILFLSAIGLITVPTARELK